MRAKLPFSATYQPGFSEEAFVEETIKAWQAGCSAFIVLSSGSSGKPKHISLPRELLIWSAQQTQERLGFSNPKIFCCLPIKKTGGFIQLIRALVYDCPIHFAKPSAAPQVPVEASIASFSPMQLAGISDLNPTSISTLKNILIGGAAVPLSLKKKIQSWRTLMPQTQFWETYGMTETASHIALKNLTKGETLFRCQNGVKITSQQHGSLIQIEALDITVDSNDLLLIEGSLFSVQGRADDVINSGGIKIHPSLVEPEIDAVLRTFEISSHFFLGKLSDNVLGEKAVLVIQGKRRVEDKVIIHELKNKLPPYHAPKEIRYVDHLPMTDTGKIIRLL